MGYHMSNTIGIIMIMIAVACMLMAQGKSVSRRDRRTYGLLGSLTSIIIAVEASRRGEMGVMLLFAAGAGFSVIGIVLDLLKPTKPDA